MTRTGGCRKWRRELLRFLDDELAVERRLLVEHHLDDCGSCRDAARFHLEVERVLHLDAGLEPDAAFEARIVTGVNERLLSAAVGHRRDRPSWLLAGAAVTAAAAAVCVAVVAPRPPARSDRVEVGVAVAPVPAPSTPAAPEGPVHPQPDRIADADPIEPARLLAAQRTVRDALLVACSADDDFREVFFARTSALADERWPIDGLVRSAIDDPDPALSNAALRGAMELDVKGALPAVHRAVRRDETADAALLALGALERGPVVPVSLRRGLDEPTRVDASIDGLVRHGSPAAARLLAERIDDPDLGQRALAGLLRVGNHGLAELLRRPAAVERHLQPMLARGDTPEVASRLAALLDQTTDADIVERCIDLSTTAGAVMFPAVGRRLDDDAHRSHALSALADAAATEALVEIMRGAARGAVVRDDARRELTRSIELFCDRSLALAAARDSDGLLLVEALDATGRFDAWSLRLWLDDGSFPPPVRAEAALRLAMADAVLPEPLVEKAMVTLLVDVSSSARLLVAAARAASEGDIVALADRLAPIGRVSAREILRRAEAIAGRMRQSERLPEPHELRRLIKRLRAAVPRL